MPDVFLSEPPHILDAFDPGVTTGWARFIDGELKYWNQLVGLDALTDHLESLSPKAKADIIVMEKYALFKWLALQQSGSKMEVAQAEGIIKSYVRRNAIRLVEQSPQILSIAKLWSKVDHSKGSHGFSHWKSALNHGYYYLVSNKMILPEGLQNE